MILLAFGTMSQLFHRIVRLIKVYPTITPTKPLGFAASFCVFWAAMTITPLTITVSTLGTIPALAITPEEILSDPKLEARAREPLGQGVGDLPLGPHLNEIDGALSGVLLHLEPPQFEVLAAVTQCAGIASEARHAGVVFVTAG